jgi:hypothetical protein
MNDYAWNCNDEDCPEEIVAIGFDEYGQVYAMCPSCMASQINDQAAGIATEVIATWSGTHILTAQALAELFETA